jgi:hypothetical protein
MFPNKHSGLPEAGLDEARAALLPADRTAPSRPLWPGIESRLAAPPAARPAIRRWAFPLVVLAILLGIVLLPPGSRPPRPDPLPAEAKLRVLDVKLDQRPAQVFLYETRDADRTFVWVEKQ